MSTSRTPVGEYPHSATHPLNNPALAVELTMRERKALMTAEDWALNIDRLLATPVGVDEMAAR